MNGQEETQSRHSERPPSKHEMEPLVSQHSRHSQQSHHSQHEPKPDAPVERPPEATYSKNERRFFALPSQCSSKGSVPSSQRSDVSSKASYKKDAPLFFDDPVPSSK